MPDPVLAGPGKSKTLPAAFLSQEFVRDLDEDACAVAGLGIGTDSATVLEITEYAEGVRHDLVSLAALQISDEADAAGVVLEAGVEETLSRWGLMSAGCWRRFAHFSNLGRQKHAFAIGCRPALGEASRAAPMRDAPLHSEHKGQDC